MTQNSNTSKLLREQRSKGLQTEVTDPTLHQTTEGGYAIRHRKDNNGLRGQKHNIDNPFRSPKLLFGNPKLLVSVDLRTEIIIVVELTLLQKYQQSRGEYIRYSARLTYPIS
jgi:hypothetical protein